MTAARGKLGDLGSRTGDLERALFVQTTEAELLSRRAQDLENRLNEQGRLLAERDYQLDRMRHELDAARKNETDLRGELSTTGNRSSTGGRQVSDSDITQLEAQLAAAIEERAKLQREIGTMKRDAESTWAAERVENALLRERINDVAAEVARLTGDARRPGLADRVASSPTPRALAAAPRHEPAKCRPKAATTRTRSPTASAPCRPPRRALRQIKLSGQRVFAKPHFAAGRIS